MDNLRIADRSSAAEAAAGTGARQAAQWGGSHAAVLTSAGSLVIANAASWEVAASLRGGDTSAVLASAPPGECCVLESPQSSILIIVWTQPASSVFQYNLESHKKSIW